MHYINQKNLLKFVLLFSVPCLLNAEPIQPDRPGFSTGTYTVEPGLSHLEFGFQSDYASPMGESNSSTLPLLNYRRGLTADTELNLLWDGWSQASETQKSRSVSDILVGLKHRLIVNDTYNISVLGNVSLPTGSNSDFESTSLFLALLWDYAIAEKISAFGTLQGVSFVEDQQRSNNFQPAVGLSFTHTDTISTFIEYYHDISLNIDTPDSRVFDLGIAYLLTSRIQLDLNAGFALDKYGSDFIGMGVAVSF